MKSFLKSVLSETVRQSVRRCLNWGSFAGEYYYDAKRFARHSSALVNPRRKSQISAHIIMDYHRLEKGMALPESRPGFGQDVIERLVTNLDTYLAVHGPDELFNVAVGVLRFYQERQARLDFQMDRLDRALERFTTVTGGADGECGVKRIASDDLFPIAPSDAEQFINSRHSVRKFTGSLIADDTVLRIAKLAQRAPSVCNRQCGRLYYAIDRAKIAEILKFQNGNRGFGHTLGGVFVVAADVSAFTSLGERNQAYVDGGIFAMQTLAAIHSQGLGGCMLNWSMMSDRDKALRKAFGILPEHVVITMIGFGEAVADPEVAVSPRINPAMMLQRL